MMKKRTKFLSMVLALAVMVSMFGSGAAVFAEGNSEPSSSAGQQDSSSVPAPEYVEPYATAYTLSKNGTLRYGDTTDITVTVYDPSAAAEEVTDATASIINESGFSYASSPASPEMDESGKNLTGLYVYTFKNVKYSGGSNVLELEIGYGPHETFVPGYKRVSFTVAQCNTAIPTPAPEPLPTPEPMPTPEPEIKTPTIIVKSADFGGTEVEAGKEFTLTLTLFTTTGSENLTDVMVSLMLPKDVTLATGNLNSYIGPVGPEGTRTVTYQIMPSVNFVDGVASIGVSMSGIGEKSNRGVSADTSVSVPVVLPERFDVTNMEVPETILMGEEGYLSVTYVNKGKGRINNLSAEIMGENMSNPGQSQFIGNVEPGTENSVDFSVMAIAEGPITGMVLLTYEDDKGDIKTIQKDFSCTVEPMPEFDPGMDFPGEDMMEMEEPSAGMPWWGWLLIVGGAAVIVIAVAAVRKKKKAKALAALEDEDEDL